MTALSTAILRALQDEEEENNTSLGKFFDFAHDNYLAYIGIIIASLVVLIASVCLLKAYCKQRYGVEICPGAAQRRNQSDHNRILQQERFAVQIQLQLDEEERRLAATARRKVRRKKYVSLVKNNTMIVAEKDLYWQTGDDSKDLEAGSNPESELQEFDPNNDHFLLTLPSSNNVAKGERRRVPANCTICLTEYTVGDAVVWSTNSSCIHAFHDDCILTWLSKGKKRCPICRKTFVPTKGAPEEEEVVKELPDEDVIDDLHSEASQESDTEDAHVASHDTVEAS